MAQSSGSRRNGTNRMSQTNRNQYTGQNGGQTQYYNQIPQNQNIYQQPQYPQQGVYQQVPQQNAYQQPENQHGLGINGQTFVQRGTQQTQKQGLTPEQKKERLRRKQELLKRKRRNKRFLLVALLIAVVLGVYFGINYLNRDAEVAVEEKPDPLDQTVDEAAEEAQYVGPPVATISFVGDVSTSSAQISDATRSDGTFDFAKSFMDVAWIFEETDYAVANFESTMVDGLAYGTEPYYNAPVQLAGTLRSLGIRLVSTANTYMLNNGIEGLTSTKRYLQEADLKTVGTYLSQKERDENGSAYIREIHGIRFAFLSYTKGTESVMMPEGCEYAMNTLYTDYSDYWTDLRKSQLRSDIQACKDAGAEVIIALVHWGSEYGRSISEPQKEVADLLLGNGVDVIVGTHSHVANEMGFREVEIEEGVKKNCFVAYGIGDFYTDPEQDSGQVSMVLNLTFSRNEEGTVEISEAGYIPIYQNIVESGGKKTFEVLDVYSNLASLFRTETITSTQAVLYNNLLNAVDSLHTYAGEEHDAGPKDEDLRVVRQAIEDGVYSNLEIKEMQKEERKAAKEAAAAADNGG